MEALHIIYQHWFITCLLVFTVGISVAMVAEAWRRRK
jgi:hypothetical protein